jgi:hypothetical protein
MPWPPILQGTLRADLIVNIAPGFKDALRFDRRSKDVRVEAFVTQPPADAVDERILHGFAGPDELEANVARIRSGIHRAADEFAVEAGVG